MLVTVVLLNFCLSLDLAHIGSSFWSGFETS